MMSPEIGEMNMSQKRPFGAIALATEEATGMDQESDGATTAGEINDATLILAMHGT